MLPQPEFVLCCRTYSGCDGCGRCATATDQCGGCPLTKSPRGSITLGYGRSTPVRAPGKSARRRTTQAPANDTRSCPRFSHGPIPTCFLVACPLLRTRAYFMMACHVWSRSVQCSSKLPAEHEPLLHSVAFMLMFSGRVFRAHVVVCCSSSCRACVVGVRACMYMYMVS